MADRDSSDSGRENVNPNSLSSRDNSNSSAADGGINPAIKSGSEAFIGPSVPPLASIPSAGPAIHSTASGPIPISIHNSNSHQNSNSNSALNPAINSSASLVSSELNLQSNIHLQNSIPTASAGASHGGGNTAPSFDFSAYAAGPQGATSALPNARHTSPGAASSLSNERIAINRFGFENPFVTGVDVRNHHLSASQIAMLPSASAAVVDPQFESYRRVAIEVADKPFSQMSAEDLAKSVVSKISNFNNEVWIREDISGPAVLESVEPPNLSDTLLAVAKITSDFHRLRIMDLIFSLVEKDLSIDESIRAKWATARTAKKAVPANTSTLSPIPTSSADVSRILFPPTSTSTSSGHVALSTPAMFSSDPRTQQQLNQEGSIEQPSFMSEIPYRVAFPVCENTLFDFDKTRGRATVNGGGGASISAGNFNITINQPSSTPPAYCILESCSDPQQFHAWLRKNRKEMLLARPVDRRLLNELCAREVQEEISRIICTAGADFKLWFNSETPYPTCWPDVSDSLLLKVLFGMHGPRNAMAAKERLEARPFFFNDSTTYQDQFTGKLRKFNNEFKTTLQDFSFISCQWAKGDILTKEMIRDAYLKCFSSLETIKNPSGVSVPKCTNLFTIRELVRQKRSLVLEEIMNHLTDHVELQDQLIRSTKGLAYLVTPWNYQAKKGKKRDFNQMSAPASQGATKAGGGKPPRPPALFPRCNNCGSKAHACGERTCYLFGHEKGLGANGLWPDGTPSLKLLPAEWSAWKQIRHAIFYSYPENQKKKVK